MKLLAIDRSTDVQSVAVAVDGKVEGEVFAGMDSRSADWPVRIRDFLSARSLSLGDLDCVLVGRGPGSFAGIRAALAFAQGIALGNRALGRTTEVVGLPSAIALARDEGVTAVVGDARRGRFWIVVYEGARTVRDFFLIERGDLAGALPGDCAVTTPDGERIGALLEEAFPGRYLGSATPLAERLAAISVANPALPGAEPLPIYLQAAVNK